MRSVGSEVMEAFFLLALIVWGVTYFAAKQNRDRAFNAVRRRPRHAAERPLVAPGHPSLGGAEPSAGDGGEEPDLLGGESYEPGGVTLRCAVCGHQGFHQREAKLNTTMMTLFDLDWANASASCLVCTRCRHIHWFLPQS